MPVSEKDREAYEAGREFASRSRDIVYDMVVLGPEEALWCSCHSASEVAAFKKGLNGEQLDEDTNNDSDTDSSSDDDTSTERDSRDDEGSYSDSSSSYTASSTTTSSDSDSGISFVFIFLVVVGLAFLGFISQIQDTDGPSRGRSYAPPTGRIYTSPGGTVYPPGRLEPPPMISDKDESYAGRRMAKEDVVVYTDYPRDLGSDTSSLQTKAIIHAREWVATEPALILAKRQESRVIEGTVYGKDALYAPPLTIGQTIYLYTYLGEDCWKSWVHNQFLTVCGVDTGGIRSPERWMAIKMPDGTQAWTNALHLFLDQRGLNNELGEKIADSALELPAKLTQIDLLLEQSADLNGSGGLYGTAPVEAAIRTKNVDLLKELALKGMNFRNNEEPNRVNGSWKELLSNGIHLQSGEKCPAFVAAQLTLEPGGDALLEFLLENGMQLECLGEPPLHAFLRFGIQLGNYPIERAVKIAEILPKNGANFYQRDSEGKSLFDMLDLIKEPSRASELKEQLSKLAPTEFPI